jgi:hypothetical protein
MFGVVRGMGIMTCPAGPTLYLQIDMDVMKILFTVPKTGQSGGKLLLGNGLLMTHKTELIIREVFPQYSEVIGTMGRMTA